MTTRRGYLAGLGTVGLTALAGCDALNASDNDSGDRLEPADLEGWTPQAIQPPRSLPFSLPGEYAAAHEERTRAFLDMVPANPSVPNEVIQDQLRGDRDRLEERLQEGSDGKTPLAKLADWRGYRASAANLYGSYTAASGGNDADVVEERRQTLREHLREFQATIEYSASSPIEAVVVFESVEDRVEQAIRLLQPTDPYPSDPTANVEQAGAAFESVEEAAAALDDARGIRESFLQTRQETSSQWSRLTETSQGIRVTVDRTRRERIPHPDEADPDTLFSSELTGVDRELFRYARRSVDSRAYSLRQYRQAGRVANTVLEAGQQLASIAAFDAVISALEDGSTPSIQSDETQGQSVATIQSAADDAAETLEAIREVTYPNLTAAVAEQAVGAYRFGREYLDEYRFDPEEAEAAFRYASLYGAVAPDVASFLASRLEGG